MSTYEIKKLSNLMIKDIHNHIRIGDLDGLSFAVENGYVHVIVEPTEVRKVRLSHDNSYTPEILGSLVRSSAWSDWLDPDLPVSEVYDYSVKFAQEVAEDYNERMNEDYRLKFERDEAPRIKDILRSRYKSVINDSNEFHEYDALPYKPYEHPIVDIVLDGTVDPDAVDDIEINVMVNPVNFIDADDLEYDLLDWRMEHVGPPSYGDLE